MIGDWPKSLAPEPADKEMDHGRGHQEHQERRKILRGGKRVSLPEEQALHQGCRLQDQAGRGSHHQAEHQGG